MIANTQTKYNSAGRPIRNHVLDRAEIGLTARELRTLKAAQRIVSDVMMRAVIAYTQTLPEDDPRGGELWAWCQFDGNALAHYLTKLTGSH